jgi:hypothetical protein
MPPLTLKIITGILQMHGPDAAIASDNQGIESLLGVVRMQMAGEAEHAVVTGPDAVEVLYVPAAERREGRGDGGGGRSMDRNSGGGSDRGGRGGRGGGGAGNDGGGGGGGGGSMARTKPKDPKPFAKTIFRKGGYGKSVYGPKYIRIDL